VFCCAATDTRLILIGLVSSSHLLPFLITLHADTTDLITSTIHEEERGKVTHVLVVVVPKEKNGEFAK
jgi:hypothetical protein